LIFGVIADTEYGVTRELVSSECVWKIRDKYPHNLDVIKRGARQGRKENAVTCPATQVPEDFEKLYDITWTAGERSLANRSATARNRSMMPDCQECRRSH
jgi:hypothetical protein